MAATPVVTVALGKKECNCFLKAHIPFPDDQSCGKEEWPWECWLGIVRSVSGKASTVCALC